MINFFIKISYLAKKSNSIFIKLYSKPISVYTTREAEQLWRGAENTVNIWCNRGKFSENEARKSGEVWLVTCEGMNRLTRK
ncbi:helix-turn-helix domain-containing protein [Bacillus thuringiensis]